MAYQKATSHDPVERALQRAHAILPDQGPIGVFIHHNTLHAFQHLSFHDGVQQGAERLGAQPYLELHEFRAAHARGRIADRDISDVIQRRLGDKGDVAVASNVSRGDLWRTLMVSSVDVDDVAGLVFASENGNVDLPSQELVAASRDRLRRLPLWRSGNARTPKRHRDALVALGASDADTVAHPELIRLCSVFLDHGQALSPMPNRTLGFLGAVDHLFTVGAAEPRACAGVSADMRRIVDKQLTAHEVIRETVELLGVTDTEVEAYVLATTLALPGWAGMFSRLERHPEEHEGERNVSLADFVAVRLVYDRRAAEQIARAHSWSTKWCDLRTSAASIDDRTLDSDAWLLASVARATKLSEIDVRHFTDENVATLFSEIDGFPELLRRQLWMEAYEGFYRRQTLDAMSMLRSHLVSRVDSNAPRPHAQFVFCIDEREESVRRALEEQSLRFETFGVAGFFGFAIDYQGIDDTSTAAYCPVVVTPAHEVHEAPLHTERGWHAKRATLRDKWKASSQGIQAHSRTLAGGAGLSFVLGPLAGALAVARVVSPRGSLGIRDRVRATFVPHPATRLMSLRAESVELSTAAAATKPRGFSVTEAADRVWNTLHNIGMTTDFAPTVVFLGHGSTSLNNPHESAHDCGACGGRRGGANARVFAEMANNRTVRDVLKSRGMSIPDDTWFIGALHDTADDSVRYFDLDTLPTSLSASFDVAAAALDRARMLSAAERCRRFEDAPLGISPRAALRHVEGRSTHLAQPRPEYGHCTNAIAVVGRRTMTRGLHLDRRPFLISYDPTIDNDDKIIERILAAVGPVGAGISLEYYFSSVDNEVFGCGTKLPHNVTGLIGVMSGHQSDLRTGLPLQMVEIHEPMRLLLIVEATTESLLTVAGRQAEVAELVVNEWVQLVSVHPVTGEMNMFRNGGFEPYVAEFVALPVVNNSAQWHAQRREHLPPAFVQSAIYDSTIGESHV